MLLYLWQLLIRSYDKPIQHIKKQRHYFANKGKYSQNYGFSSSRVWMLELDHKKRWVLKNWHFWTVMLDKTLESPLDCKEIQPVHPKGNQPWRFIGRTDAEAETTILWPPEAKNWLIRKDPDSGKLKAGGEGDDRRRDGWMGSLTQWTWVWAGSRRQWRTGKSGVLQSMGSLRVGHDWVTEPEKAMAPHSSTLAWKIPWMEEPTSRLQSMGLQRVWHDWATSHSRSCSRLMKENKAMKVGKAKIH